MRNRYDDLDEGRECNNKANSKGPHYDAEKNKDFFIQIRRQIYYPNPLAIDVHISVDRSEQSKIANPDGEYDMIIVEPFYIGFYWKELLVNKGYVISFHQGMNEFKKNLVDTINYFLSREMLTRFNPAKPKPAVSRMKESSEFLFGHNL